MATIVFLFRLMLLATSYSVCVEKKIVLDSFLAKIRKFIQA